MPKTNSKRRENKATGGLKYIKLPRLGVMALQTPVGEAASRAFTWWGGVRGSGGGTEPPPILMLTLGTRCRLRGLENRNEFATILPPSSFSPPAPEKHRLISASSRLLGLGQGHTLEPASLGLLTPPSFSRA